MTITHPRTRADGGEFAAGYWSPGHSGAADSRSAARRRIHGRSILIGAAGGLVLASVFIAVVAGSAGWEHLSSQLRENWWLLLPLLAGFITQVTLMVELRRRHRAMHTAAVSVGAGAGVSGVGMVACCAHHLADFAPLLGATGIATFLTDAQQPLMVGGLALNLLAVAYAARLLRRAPVANEAGVSCKR
jgi:hypothetical protein